MNMSSQTVILIQAIALLRPAPSMSVRDDATSIDDVEWNDDRPMPSQSEIDSVLEKLWKEPVDAEYKELRELYLNRIGGLAGRASRGGKMALAAALDGLAEDLLVLDASPAVQQAVDAEGLRVAYRDGYKAIAAAALAKAPDQATALQWKGVVQGVFK